MLSKNTVHHTAGNTTNRKLDFAPWLLPGETITTATVVSSSATLMVANITIFQKKQVRFQTTGGVADETATITAMITTSLTERHIESFDVIVDPAVPVPIPDALVLLASVTPSDAEAGITRTLTVTSMGGTAPIDMHTPTADGVTFTPVSDGVWTFTLVGTTLDDAGTNVVMSNGALTATHTSTSSGGVRSTDFKSAGKYYFEITVGTTNGTDDFVGIILSTAAISDPITFANVTGCYPNLGGFVYSNGVYSGKSLGAISHGVVGVAIDLDNRKAWFRRNGGAWFSGGSEDPATATGGVPIAPGSFSPAVGFLGTGSLVGDNFTANFGQAPFGTVAPAGFGNWF